VPQNFKRASGNLGANIRRTAQPRPIISQPPRRRDPKPHHLDDLAASHRQLALCFSKLSADKPGQLLPAKAMAELGIGLGRGRSFLRESGVVVDIGSHARRPRFDALLENR
jgi:hypothetical protein